VCVCIYDVFFTRVFFLVSLVCLLSFFLCFFNRVLMCCLMVIGCWLGFATSMLNVH
jgi:hypothetical protein